MSRRDSRVSMNARQNDALFEFENFKKKFLLANKHITKLNSSLAMRIEELNAQISTLYTENIRLRASEINLAAQLKREREKSRKVIAETEAAALGLTKHMGFLRQAFCISEAPSSSSSPTPPRATQRPLPSTESPTSPAYPRLSRAPTISQIYEDEEPSDPTEDEDEVKEKSPRYKTKTKRLSTSRLPLPARISSPPPIPQVDLSVMSTSGPSKRKPLRRQSGLVARQDSPVLGSPEVEDEDEMAAVDETEEPETAVVRKEKRKAVKDKGKEKEHDVSLRKKLREEMGNEGKKLKLADVTNSPRSRPSQPVESVVSEVELEVAHSSHNRREFLCSSPPRASIVSRSNSNYLPISHNASSLSQIPTANSFPNNTSEGPETLPVGGRERRMRKSINYAEPKLNTKMRNPDSEPASRKRKSAAAVMSSRSEKRIEAATDGEIDDTDTGARSSLEGPASGQPSRAKHRATSAGVDPTQLPLPVSRPGSSTDTTSLTSTITTSYLPPKQLKSRPFMYADDDDVSSESEDADTEYAPSGPTGKGGPSWVNVTDRRRGGGGKRATVSKHEDDDEVVRRHSLAV